MGKEHWFRYLLAKRTVDDRALNREVFRALRSLWHRQAAHGQRVLEIGAGAATMPTRLATWGLTGQGEYVLLDADPQAPSMAQRWLEQWSRQTGWLWQPHARGGRLQGPHSTLELRWIVQDLYTFLEAAQEATFDGIIAHAFLDLVHLPWVLPRLWRLLRPRGWAYFTLNYDGWTAFLPQRPELKETRLLERYHASMDQRRHRGMPAGTAATGRALWHWALTTDQVEIVAAGPSDWAVWPHHGSYPHDEAFFLDFILDTIYQALNRDDQLDPEVVERWYHTRHQDRKRARLAYLAHQWDFLLRKVA